MNATSLWAGTDYAYIYERGRETFSTSVKRVRIVRVFKKKPDYYSERMSTFAVVNFIDMEGNIKKDTDGKTIIQTIKARDIVNYWDEYWDEHQATIQRAEEQKRERELERAREAKENQQIIEALANLGIKVQVNYNGIIYIDRKEILEWMSAATIAS